MMTSHKPVLALFVDRGNQQWVVRDGEGNFWILPAGDDPWDQRQPFQLTDDTDLEPVPGHYKSLLGLPI